MLSVNNERTFTECTDDSQVTSHPQRSILEELKIYPFPDDVKTRANLIYNQMTYSVRRKKIRFQLLFFCVYNAYLELGLEEEIDPIVIGSAFGLDVREMQNCYSLFSPLQTGYRPPNKKISPLSYFPQYCDNEHLKLSPETIDNLKTMTRKILAKDPTLSRENPQTVAAGLFRYFVVTNGIIIPPYKLKEITGRSNVTIDNLYKRVAKVDNS
jgi:transcription initiation factor TFIIIB Brf1 subunit/transcription initiation factor TFIIB